MIIFTPQNLVLLIAGLINLVMSIWIFTRGLKNKINLYFGLVTLFNFLWAIGLVIINLAINYELTRFFASFVYLIALLIVISLFYFTVHFPYESFKLKKLYQWVINFFLVFYVIYCVFGYKFFVPSVSLSPKVMIYYEFWSYTIFSVVLVILMLSAIRITYKKYKLAEGVFKRQLLLILIAIIIGTSFGSYFDLFFMYYQDHGIDNTYLGPLFTLFINFVVFSFIVMPKHKISS